MDEALNPATPGPLHLEHLELRHFLAKMAHEKGETGDAARLVARLLDAHMHKEETFVLPALAVLPRLAEGRFEPAMADAIAHAEWLKKNLAELVAEHRAISAGLERLIAAGRAAERFELVEFAEKVLNHARLEELVLYPAVIVCGEYLKHNLETTVELGR